MMPKHRLRHVLLGIVVFVSLTLTACQGIPSSGGVHQGLPELSPSEQEVQYRPDSPMPDASQEEIVLGFLEAGSSATNDYEIAREFLTRDYRSQWNPNLSVTINDGMRSFSEGPDDTALLKIDGIASIDERGILTQLDTQQTTQFQFELEKENDEWRIASAPNGVILDRTTFLDVWTSHELFFNGPRDTLIPDTRWFLNRATVGTHIVNQLLAGPTEQLTGVAVSAFPTGTRLSSDAVIIDEGTARIDLSPEFESVTNEAVELVKRQLAASLYSLPGVSKFEVSVGGVELFSGPVALPQSLVPNLSDGASAAGVLYDGTFGSLSAAGITDDADWTRAFESITPTRIVMTRDGQAAVALTPDGLHWVSDDGTFLLDDREGLLEPTTDPLGFVWILKQDASQVINAWHPEGDNQEIATPELAGEHVVAMRISQDGNRIAFLVSDEKSSKVMITGIVRDDKGVPQRFVDLGAPWLSWVAGVPIDLDWIDAQSIAVLSRSDSDSSRFTMTGPGQLLESRAGVQGATAIASGGRLQATYVLSGSGDVSVPQGTSGWQRQAERIDVLVKRG